MKESIGYSENANKVKEMFLEEITIKLGPKKGISEGFEVSFLLGIVSQTKNIE